MGWGVAGLVVLVTIGIVGMGSLLIVRVARLQDRQSDLLSQQAMMQDAQEKSWSEQHAAIKTLTAWGEYVKDRFAISAENGPALPHVPPKSPLTGTASKEKP